MRFLLKNLSKTGIFQIINILIFFVTQIANKKMLEGIEVKLNSDFFDDKEKWLDIADKIVFTGMIDEYYDYCYGELEYRGLDFEFNIRY